MDPLSVVAIVGATAAVISAFRDGLDMFKSWRKKRKQARLSRLNNVEQSLERNPPEVERNYKQHVSQMGRRFEKGDDISNKSFARIIEKFTRAVALVIKELSESNSKHLFEVSEKARRDSLEVMLQLYQRLHVSAPITQVNQPERRPNDEKAQSRCSLHSNELALSSPCHVQVFSFVGDNLQEILEQIPKANPNITLSGPSIVVSHTVGNYPQSPGQTPYAQGVCQCDYSITKPEYVTVHSDEKIQNIGSPLKKRLDEMDQMFALPTQTNLGTQKPLAQPTAHSLRPFPFSVLPVESRPTMVDIPPPKSHSWAVAPSTTSSTLSLSTRTAPLSRMSESIYSPTNTKSLQEKLNAMTRTMISPQLTPMSTPLSSPAPSMYSPSMYSGFLPAPARTPPGLPQINIPPVNEHGERVFQWAESVQTTSIPSPPESVSGVSDMASFVFPGVRRYAGPVRMTGGLPTPPP